MVSEDVEVFLLKVFFFLSVKVSGTLKLLEYEDGLLIRGEITGLPPGLHGIHVHEIGKTGDNCTAAGAHFNPENVSRKLLQIQV